MARFWGKLFGINFAMGVATGITMEFQFGTNWAYYSHYVGDIFGAPLALEGLMAFFLESTFVGLFFFGWDRLPKIGHLMVTWLVALGIESVRAVDPDRQRLDAASGRRRFNFETMRMELTVFWHVLFNPVAQAKFVHTVAAGYVTGSMFVLAVASYYLLRRAYQASPSARSPWPRLRARVGAVVVVLGDESGYTACENQKMKLAAIEAMWKTEPAPAAFTLIGIPDSRASRRNAGSGFRGFSA